MKKYNCNNTLDYVHEAARMCRTPYRRGCLDCPLCGLGCKWDDVTAEHIRRVQAWSDAHPLTNEQYEILKAMHLLGYNYVAQDSNGECYVYMNCPAKSRDNWLSIGHERVLSSKDFKEGVVATISPLVSWSDDEPLNIAAALEQAEEVKP